MDMPSHYVICVAEHLDGRLANWLGGLEIMRETNCQETTLYGELTDQAALFGVLGRIRDLGLTLISVQRLSPQKERKC